MAAGKHFQLAWRERRRRLLQEALANNLAASRRHHRLRRQRAFSVYRVLLCALLVLAVLGVLYELAL